MLNEIKEKTYQAFCESIRAGVEVVVLDDSNVTSQEYLDYLKVSAYKQLDRWPNLLATWSQ